jgi:hypothetical protein
MPNKQGIVFLWLVRMMPWINKVLIVLYLKVENGVHQLSVEILTERVNESSEELAGKTGLRFAAILPFIGRADAEGQASFERGTGRQAHLRPIEFKLSLAQDVGELIVQVENRPKFVVLENFHYLSSDQQATIAFDLRTFEEMGIRFIVLGVWKEANRLIQYDGDLQDHGQARSGRPDREIALARHRPSVKTPKNMHLILL